MSIYNGYTPEIDTPEKRAAQFVQDLRHYIAVRKGEQPDDCDCGACQRVIKAESASLDVEIYIAEMMTNGQDAHYSRLQSLLEQKRQAAEIEADAEWLGSDIVSTGLELDGSETGISQPIIF